MIPHKGAPNIGEDPDNLYLEPELDRMQTGYDLIAKYFPDTFVAPTFGNNDAHYHDTAIESELREKYYNKYFEVWF